MDDSGCCANVWRVRRIVQDRNLAKSWAFAKLRSKIRLKRCGGGTDVVELRRNARSCLTRVYGWQEPFPIWDMGTVYSLPPGCDRGLGCLRRTNFHIGGSGESRNQCPGARASLRLYPYNLQLAKRDGAWDAKALRNFGGTREAIRAQRRSRARPCLI